MRRTEFQQLGPVVDELFKKLGFDKKMKEIAAKKAWENVVGKTFANATTKINFYNNTLFVYVGSPAIRYELVNRRALIAERINEVVGERIVYEIVIK